MNDNAKIYQLTHIRNRSKITNKNKNPSRVPQVFDFQMQTDFFIIFITFCPEEQLRLVGFIFAPSFSCLLSKAFLAF